MAESSHRDWRAKIIDIGAFLAVIFSILFANTLSLHSSNVDEFSLGYVQFIAPLLLILASATIVWLLILLLLKGKERGSERSVALVLATGFLVYLQSNILLWDYGLLNGNDIVWGEFLLAEVVDLLTWVVILAGAWVYSGIINRYKGALLGFLLALNIANFGIAALKETKWIGQQKQTSTESIYNFSPQKNVVFVLLDMFESPAFKYITDREPKYKSMFDDFVYYRNTLSAFPTTSPSIPAILSGKMYDNSIPLGQFLEAVMPVSIPSVLYKNGYQVDLVTLGHYCNGIEANSCSTLAGINAADYQKLRRDEFYRLLDIALFRAAPQFLKRFIYNDQSWLVQKLSNKREGPSYHVNSIEFVESIVRNAKPDAIQPTFKFLHLMIPHTPMRLDPECNFSRANRQASPKDYAVQARCALYLAHQVIGKMKELGVYDNSLVIISADHGIKINYGHYQKKKGLPYISEALPLLLIKPPGAHAPFQVSEAPTQLIDLPHTIATAMGIEASFPGEAIFGLKTDRQRTRTFRDYSWTNDDWQREYLPPIREFSVNGHAWDLNSWKREGELIPPR